MQQEGTKAKINVAHSHSGVSNDRLHAPDQIAYSMDSNLDRHSDMATVGPKLVTFPQIELATGLTSVSYDRSEVYPHYTFHSRDVLSDSVHGGLKKDLSLAFELSDSDFKTSLGTGSNSNY